MRQPSYGQAMACELRKLKATRAIPLVFLQGDPEKSERVRKLLPDAQFAVLSKVGAALRKAIARPVAEPVIPKVEHQPAAPKLRIREDSVVALLHAPDGFELGGLPPGARVGKRIVEAADVIVVFVRSAASLGRELAPLAAEVRPGRIIWIAWRKHASGLGGELKQPGIVEMCSHCGLTAYKSCALDETWSAIAIARRKK
jgi:hypothetical protein